MVLLVGRFILGDRRRSDSLRAPEETKNCFKEFVTLHKTRPFHNLLVFLSLVDFFFFSSSTRQRCDYLIACIVYFLNQGLAADLIEFHTS